VRRRLRRPADGTRIARRVSATSVRDREPDAEVIKGGLNPTEERRAGVRAEPRFPLREGTFLSVDESAGTPALPATGHNDLVG